MNRFEALKHAVRAHAGAVDKCGRPYILHPIAVAEAVDGESAYLSYSSGSVPREDAVVVALLHDVWEDTDYKLPPLPGRLAEPLSSLTRYSDETYANYIERLADEPLACLVKLADLWHNLSPERQACLPEQERKGLEKRYLKARDRIWEALGHEWWPEQEATTEGVFV
ncbi:MAG TPA: hypothetical protein VD761_07725 [Solirubrobacterales bacterium]|nr:hypothetical protein [Solirubrobacterales bacterium]